MLIHHLFYIRTDLFNDIHLFRDIYLVNEIGVFCKLCVAIFVFLSGYGLAVSQGKVDNIFAFYKHRYKKLYFNFWFIWLIFVPIGVFVFHRTFADVYGTNIILKSIADLFGLSLIIFNEHGYNPTWWFYSCIILLYLIYPFLANNYQKYNPISLFILCIGISFAGFIPFIRPITYYFLPFVAGMVVAEIPAQKLMDIKIWELLLGLFVICLLRNFSGRLQMIIDTLICLDLAILLHKISINTIVKKIFVELGKHSMNIFLFHTFIYYYWFKDIIYYTKNPLVIFLELIVICYIISVFLEFIKQKIGFYKLIK